jgi:hypothetical protein
VIIGLCGAAGAGKGSVASILESRGFATLSFADPIYEAVSAITGLTVSELQDRGRKENALGWISYSPRRLLQSLGTDWGRNMIHPEIWVMATMQRMLAGGDYCIPDVRFVNEAAAIRARGGVVWRVERPGHSLLTGDAAAHESERGIPDEYVDSRVVNDGTLDDLQVAVDAATRCLQADIMR